MKTDFKTIDVAIKEGTAILRLNNPPVNQLSAQLREDMQEAFDQAFASDEVKSVVLTGTGKNFIAGADIKEMLEVSDEKALLQGVLAYDAFYNQIEDAQKPVVAAINGPALGGGLELAMSCHCRVAAAPIKVGQPEVQVGLIPGAGGTQRLPRLVGLPKALEMITVGNPIPAEQARELGLVDEVVPPGELESRALEKAGELAAKPKKLEGCRTGRRTDKLPSAEEKSQIIGAAREMTRKKAKDFSIPMKAIDAMDKGLSDDFQADLKVEAQIFAQCAVSQEARNMIGIFLNSRAAGRVPRLKGVAPKKIQTVAMLGLGVMGSGVSNLLLRNGYQAILWEVNEEALERGKKAVRKTFAHPIKKGSMSEADLEALFNAQADFTTDLAAVAGADLVIEAVLEDMAIKKDLWSKVDGICSPEAVFATNTSALPVSELAGALKNPARMIGLHFFNPAERMQLVEVISGRESSDTDLATGVDFSKKIKKIPVVVNDGPGFYVSRQLNALMNECFFMLEEGYPMNVVDRVLTDFGMPMGPLTLNDLTGIDIGYHVAKNFEGAFGERWKLSELHQKVFDSGFFGRKTGAGFYDYSDKKPVPNPKIQELIDSHLKENGVSPKEAADVDKQALLDRMMARAINEAAFMIAEGICDRPWDMDLAMVYGCGFPPHKGGILRYADKWGLDNVRDRLEKFHAVYGERYRPCPLIAELAEKGQNFYEMGSQK
ncbi:MAG: 3-hydroxyacyl-CoA dehydrogenase NAD-binding domain-containing protein [Desulfobacterales bacterium]|nr:3-hydroxyacyl-CoA dehydrogenase NAD-binding domain-containing protein [Desulfobacterales bacterium]